MEGGQEGKQGEQLGVVWGSAVSEGPTVVTWTWEGQQQWSGGFQNAFAGDTAQPAEGREPSSTTSRFLNGALGGR